MKQSITNSALLY